MIYQRAENTSLGKFLQVPVGYNLEHLLATTYSLCAETFVSLAIYGFLASSGDELDNVQLKEVVWQEEELHKWAKEHLTVFSHYLPTPAADKIVWEQCSALLDVCCIKVESAGKIFHPKLLLVCFKNQETGERLYRVQVGSQNLNAESAVEFSVCLEGRKLQETGNGCQLYRFFKTFCSGNLPKYLEGLKKVVFTHTVEDNSWYQITNIKFEFNGNQGRNVISALKEQFDCKKEIRVYSPFLTPDKEKKLYMEQNDFEKVCYYTNLTKSLFEESENLDNVFYIKKQDGEELVFFHAKIYCQEIEITDACAKYHVFLGSANASANGLEKNIELMVSFDWEIFFDKSLGDLPLRVKNANELYGLAHGEKYSFVQLNSNTKHEPKDDEDSRMKQSLLHYLAQCSAVLIGTTQERKWKIQVQRANVSKEIKILLVENQTYSSEMVLDTLPCGKVLRTTLEMTYKDKNGEEQRIEVTGSMPLIIPDENKKSFDENKPAPTKMFALLAEFRARDAIPRCRKRGFIRLTDDVLERLEAYLASWQSDKKAWERAKQNAENAYEGLTSSDYSDIWTEIYIADEEKEKLDALCKLLGGGE